MIYKKSTRRHFLQGIGGFTLALPFLPSLMKSAEAAALPSHRFYVGMWNLHGGHSHENVYPINSTVTANLNESTLYPAMAGEPLPHVARWGELTALKRTHAQTTSARVNALADLDNGAARVSPLIGSFIPDALLAKMNLVSGIDTMWYLGHARCAFGNFVNRDGGGTGTPLISTPIPTIDYVIQQSNKFYSDAERASVRAPSLYIGPTNVELSSYRSGASIGRNPFEATSVGQIYDRLFQGVQSTTGTTDPDASLVDLVFSDYSRLARGAFGPGRRIAASDRTRLEAYMQGLSDVAARMRAIAGSCQVPAAYSAADRARRARDGDFSYDWQGMPTNTTDRREYQRRTFELINMMLVQAFMCGTSRIVIQHLPALYDQVAFSDPHQQLWHSGQQASMQEIINASQRDLFRATYFDLMTRMNDVEYLPGTKLLDLALLHWTAEAGIVTHGAQCLPTILAGGAGGFFTTGRYVDVRNLTRTYDLFLNPPPGVYTGLPLNRLLGTICQSMGLAPDDYELMDTAYSEKFPTRGGRVPGYGDPGRDTTTTYFSRSGNRSDKLPYKDPILADMSVPLPLIKS